MKIIIFCAIIYCIVKIIGKLNEREKQNRIVREQEAIKSEQLRQKEQIRAEVERARLETKERIEAEKRRIEWQKRQDAINARLEKEQERQAKELERHEEMMMKMDHRLSADESEIAFNREQIERVFKLQEMEISARDACSYGSAEWQKHEKKVISLENQIHTFQKRIDKAKADKRFCESKLA